LKINEYKEIDGKIIKETEETRMQSALNPTDYNYNINFLQIDGLKNKEVQDKINAKLKNVPYTLEKGKNVWTDVRANFSNVLSVVITNDISHDDYAQTLNFDLTTGDEISFEKLFVSSAPIKSMIAGGMYKDFAWEKLNVDYEKNEGIYNMKDADTSELEEKILLAVNKYDKIKDEIIFSFSPTEITIYNIELRSKIDMVEYANEIAIYKRYLTEDSIFEKDDLGKKGLIVLTDKGFEDNYGQQISYGKIADNIFIEEVLWNWSELKGNEVNIVIEYVKNLSKEQKVILKQETREDRGVIFQREYNISKNDEKGYYCIMVSSYKAECSIPYFEEKDFKDYIKVKSLPRAAVGLNAFSSYMQEDYPEMQISEIDSRMYYLSPTGEFLGNTIEEVENKSWE